jgi:glutathionylspermidine synthase
MRRRALTPRPDWQASLEALEFFGWKREDGSAYWVEDACYEFSEEEIETLHEAAVACEGLIKDTLPSLMQDRQKLHKFGLNDTLVDLAQLSWRRGDPALYGRFDFAWDGRTPPRLLEYNADTPTALYEAAVVQWRWLTDIDPNGDQYNSIHERLVAVWARVAPFVQKAGGRLHLTCAMEDVDDAATCAYMADCATQAGLTARLLEIADIGLNAGRLVDLDDQAITHLFKLYPWEWMTQEDADFVGALLGSDVGVLNPPWRAVASSKAMLPEIWTRNPGHPNLAAAAWTEGEIGGDRVGKPIFGREGANIRTRFGGQFAETQGPFTDQQLIWQARAPSVSFEGRTPVFGVWVVDGEPCGLGVREDQGPITGPNACFIPHRIVR